MSIENFTPPLTGSGGQWETIYLTGGPWENGEGLVANWVGFTDIASIVVSKRARLTLVTFQMHPVTIFPENGTLRLRVLRNGAEMVSLPLLTGDGTNAQVSQAYVVPEDEGVLEADDLMSPVLDITNIHVDGYYTTIGLTFVYL